MTVSDEQIDETLRYFQERLMKTRLQLQELKKSINQTLSDIRTLDLLLKETQNKFNRRKPLDLSESSRSSQIGALTCKKCLKVYDSPEELFHHVKIYHFRCEECNQIYFETDDDHEDYFCGFWKIQCHDCFAYVQRRNLDKHVKICSFRKCYKCESNVYAKAFAYHLKVCGKENYDSRDQSTESFRKSSGSSSSGQSGPKLNNLYIPCTMVR